MTAPYRKKLIEVALPLEAINRESAREKSIRHGHPSTLHLWWARRPLAACRAVLFSSIVDDPSSRPDLFPTEEEQEAERQRLFGIIERLVKWENTTNEDVLNEARAEIMKATDGKPPPVLDPFCGGGSIPLEAQRLGLEAHASDLNPVAVLITKALIEIPPKFAGQPPVNPEARAKLGHGATWKGAQGLAEDVRYYGKWMRDRAFEKIGHLYPKAKLPDGSEATVIAWIWARVVRCPNPACAAMTPLVHSFSLGTKRGRSAWLEPDAEGSVLRFRIRQGEQRSLAREGNVGNGRASCLACQSPIPPSHIRSAAGEKRLLTQLLATVVRHAGGRIYLTPDNIQTTAADEPSPVWMPSEPIPQNPRDYRTHYGLESFSDLFTRRQLVALSTFSDLVQEARKQVEDHGHLAGLDDPEPSSYGDAVATYLAFSLDRSADYWSAVCTWHSGPKMEAIRNTFARQAVPMSWDFAEANPFSEASGNWNNNTEWTCRALEGLPVDRVPGGVVKQVDARSVESNSVRFMSCTDPPYYDNIGYADLSDFFYVWLRRSLKSIYPDLFSTLVTPKSQELVAAPYRFGGKRREAQRFFEDGLREAFARMHGLQHGSFPLTLFYAFKQAETLESGSTARASTGWETMLTGLLDSGLAVTGTWPVRSELGNRTVASGSNALASSIVLVCRPRPADASMTARRDFVASLRAELPEALRRLQQGSIAPVDLAQAAIGPGMAIFSRYGKVIESDGSTMPVRTALSLINQALDEILAEQEADFDPDTRFAIAWFEARGTAEGPYGEADVLARAKNTAVGGLEEAGILVARAGKVRLLRRDELAEGWDPARDRRLTVWEITQHLIRHLETGGESSAAELLRAVGGLGDVARELAYRVYTICERKGWAQEALGYNALVVAWPEIARLAAEERTGPAQQTLGV